MKFLIIYMGYTRYQVNCILQNKFMVNLISCLIIYKLVVRFFVAACLLKKLYLNSV